MGQERAHAHFPSPGPHRGEKWLVSFWFTFQGQPKGSEFEKPSWESFEFSLLAFPRYAWLKEALSSGSFRAARRELALGNMSGKFIARAV